MIPIHSPRKKTLLALLILAFIFLAIGATLLKGEESTNNKSQANYSIVGEIGNFVKGIVQNEGRIRTSAWKVFEEYRNASQNHDIAKIEELSYKLSSTCTDLTMNDECNLRMDSIVELTADFVKKDFSNVWYDENQIILFTDPKKSEEENKTSYTKSYIFFTRDEQGNPKVASIDPGQVFSFTRQADLTDQEIEEELWSIIMDSDKDGVPDIYELCEDTAQICENEWTKPNIRDTDGDGWWDGMESYVNR